MAAQAPLVAALTAVTAWPSVVLVKHRVDPMPKHLARMPRLQIRKPQPQGRTWRVGRPPHAATRERHVATIRAEGLVVDPVANGDAGDGPAGVFSGGHHRAGGQNVQPC